MASEPKKPKIKVGDNIQLKTATQLIPKGSEGTVVKIAKDGIVYLEMYKIPGFKDKNARPVAGKVHPLYTFPHTFSAKDIEYELVEKPEQVIYVHHLNNVDISKEVKEIEKILRHNNITNFKICDQRYASMSGGSLLGEGYLLRGLNIFFGEMRDLKGIIRSSQVEQGFSGPGIDWSDIHALKEKLTDIFSNQIVNRLQAFLDKSDANTKLRASAEDIIYHSKKPSETLQNIKQLSDKGIDLSFILQPSLLDNYGRNSYFKVADELVKKLDKKEIKEYTNWLGRKQIIPQEINENVDGFYRVYQAFGDIIDQKDIPSVLELFKEINSNEGLTTKEKEKSKSEVAEYYKLYNKEKEKEKKK